MNTQQLGTDIAGDVSFDFGGPLGAFRQTYGFKARVSQAATGHFIVTINAGEGIDVDHAEINIYHGARIGGSPVQCLTWQVEEFAPTGGQLRYDVHFTLRSLSAGNLVCVAADPSFASITIRRKVPAVN